MNLLRLSVLESLVTSLKEWSDSRAMSSKKFMSLRRLDSVKLETGMYFRGFEMPEQP